MEGVANGARVVSQTTPAVSTPPPASALDRLAHVLAVWFGCGHMPVAPGHTGTLGAVPLYLLVRPAGNAVVALTGVLVTAVGVWASTRVAQRLGRKDPQIVVIDEVAGVFVTWLGAPPTWTGLIVGAVLFRLLDQFKPWPARTAERRLPGGWGIMFDDVFAGAWGAALLLLARRFGWL